MRRLSWSALPTLALPAGALALAACGSSGGSSAASGNSALEFAQCMRAHGVASFPDPGSSGGQFFGPGSGINPQAPAFRAAGKACAKLNPSVTAAVHLSEAQKLAELRFAQCMRTHGVPSFPDPTYGPGNGPGPVIALRGMFFRVGPGIDPRSPAFRQAAGACGFKPPPLTARRQFQ
jgi:hypothetical protein